VRKAVLLCCAVSGLSVCVKLVQQADACQMFIVLAGCAAALVLGERALHGARGPSAPLSACIGCVLVSANRLGDPAKRPLPSTPQS